MVLIKLAVLVLYTFLAWVAVTQPLTLGANISLGLLVLLAITHAGECLFFRKLIGEAPGSRAWHALNVLLFGLFHMAVIRRAVPADHEQAA